MTIPKYGHCSFYVKLENLKLNFYVIVSVFYIFGASKCCNLVNYCSAIQGMKFWWFKTYKILHQKQLPDAL